MTSVTTLLPSSVALSSDNSIAYILTDIPLFCEGVMGIGVFTFLFLVKQVKLLSIFLYGSNFLAFAAATLDLGQVLARGPKKGENIISLPTVWGIIYAREVFLAFSTGFLDLFFWKLVACCPIQEVEFSGTLTNRKERKQLHSANWNRWGLIGMILKWVSLAASFSVPLLQIIWRLLPNQRQYGTIYIAQTTVETALAAVFILKLVLNISISPDEWWYAFQSYLVPMFALSMEIGLGVGNFTTFAFTETTLGRLLRAIEVYLLVLHNLHTASQLYGHDRREPEDTVKRSKSNQKKSRADTILPISSPNLGPKTHYFMNTQFKVTRQVNRRSKASDSFVEDIQSQMVETKARVVASPMPPTRNSKESEYVSGLPLSEDQQQSGSFHILGSPTDILSPKVHSSKLRPDMGKEDANEQRENDMTYPNDADRGTSGGLAEDFQFPPASQLRSSIDDILPHQTALDRTIANLRMVSKTDAAVSVPPKSRSTFNSNKTESTSNRSDFSLSIFPDPPIVPKDQVVPNYSASVDVSTTEISPEPSMATSPDTTPSLDQIAGNVGSLRSQYNVTLDRDLTEDSQMRLRDEEDETPMFNSATTGALKPMILPSMDPIVIPSEPIRGAERIALPPQSLRPLLLGKPMAAVPPLPATMVPLAQRRQRGGTISSNTRRPVISVPLLNEDKTEAAPDAFERPRPPPLTR
ncbi:hypothetical protein CPB84DRAFT_1759539 [Gymnopilus junonius]|uniref:Uncharacterized protein n=1 Tax=Gymnopilus junonius TaxID=109634 RepID=A0A9P5P352_GYMJU|nr:hypothetical protein CPB84DRAFT_1759539 [Gymnopilus junonius]